MLTIRTYGETGSEVVVLHGGPAAPGYMAPVARELSADFRVLEPFQRGSGAEPLTVATHIDDLHEVIVAQCRQKAPALVGHSWGAMLALAYAAAHPHRVGALALIGCGTFDKSSRARMNQINANRLDRSTRRRLDALADRFPDPNARLREMGRTILPLYSYDANADQLETTECDAQAHEETWADMLRLQDEGVYPAAFTVIRAPVLMLHGTHDPHPGEMIRANLQSYLPQLEYREWERCGHYPWLEKAVAREFFSALRRWLLRHSGE